MCSTQHSLFLFTCKATLFGNSVGLFCDCQHSGTSDGRCGNTTGLVDESWIVKDLKAECKRRGMVGYSGRNKADLIRTLNRGN